MKESSKERKKKFERKRKKRKIESLNVFFKEKKKDKVSEFLFDMEYNLQIQAEPFYLGRTINYPKEPFEGLFLIFDNITVL